MDVKEFLNRPYFIKKKIAYLTRELERYQIMMNSIPQPNYGSVRIDKSPSNETINQRALEKYYETEDKLKEKEKQLEIVTNEILDVIDKLENEEYRLILKYKYLDQMIWNEIADKLYLGYSTVRRYHNFAIDQLILPIIS